MQTSKMRRDIYNVYFTSITGGLTLSDVRACVRPSDNRIMVSSLINGCTEDEWNTHDYDVCTQKTRPLYNGLTPFILLYCGYRVLGGMTRVRVVYNIIQNALGRSAAYIT